MAFYDQVPQQPQHLRAQSWDPSQPPARSGEEDARSMKGDRILMGFLGASSASQHEEGIAFRAQFEEIDRVHESMSKAGRPFPPMHNRRESMPLMGGGLFVGQFPPDRMAPPRHQSISDYEQMRSNASSTSLQGYLSNQRFPTPRQTEQESMMQVKRRAAAQRERELRNYHQEQQYNRSQPGTKAERPVSPSAMNEEDRRELIARQHRALYGEGSNIYDGPPQQRPISQDARVLAAAAATSGHSNSPLGFDSYGQPPSSATDGGTSVPATAGQRSRSRSNSASSKPTNAGAFALYDGGHNSNRASSTSPGSSGQQGTAPGASSIGPIGSRPSISAGPKRNTPPTGSVNTPVPGATDKPGSLGWGSSNGPWGGSTKGSLGQTSVWG